MMLVYTGIGWWNSKSGVALRTLGVAPTVGEKGAARQGASHLTPLYAPESAIKCVGCSGPSKMKFAPREIRFLNF